MTMGGFELIRYPMYVIFLSYLCLVHTAQAKLPNKRVSTLLVRITKFLDGVYYRTDDVNRDTRFDSQMMISIPGTKALFHKMMWNGTWMGKRGGDAIHQWFQLPNRLDASAR